MTYFQLIGIIRTIDIKVPDFLPELSFYFGNPASNATMNMNCFLDEYIGSVLFIYYNFFFSLGIPFLHFAFLAGTLQIYCLLNKELLSSNDLKAGIIFFFIYFQPEYVYNAIQIITCKQIDLKSYNQANTSLECDIKIHYFIILSSIIILFAFLIPMMLYAKLTSLNKNDFFQNITIQLKNSQYAFLCINYKKQTYYWEFIRMAERLLFILIASIFNSKQVLKIILLIFITEGYNALLKIKQPFKNDQFNRLEVITNHVITTSFIIAIGVYSQQLGYTIEVIFYITFLIINWIIITYILLLVLQEIIYKIIDKLMTLIEKHMCVKKIFETLLKFLNKIPFFQLNLSLKVYLSKKKKPLLYAKIREQLLQIVKMNPQERNILFLSIKEQKSQSKAISRMASQFQEQIKSRSQLSGDFKQKKLESLLELSEQNERQDISETNTRSEQTNTRSFLKIYNEKQRFNQSEESKTFSKINYQTQVSTRRLPQSEQIIESQSQDDISQQFPKTRNSSFIDNTQEVTFFQNKNQYLYQFPVESIKRLCENQPFNLNKRNQKDIKFSDHSIKLQSLNTDNQL